MGSGYSGVSQVSVLLLADETGRGVLARPCRPHDVEVQDSVEDHTQTDGTALQPVLKAILGHFDHVPLLRFRGVLGSIASCVVAAPLWVERHDVDATRAEHGQVPARRVYAKEDVI